MSVKKLFIVNPVIPHPQWVAGRVSPASGEGCFFISTFKSKTKIGVAVRLKFIFAAVQHVRDQLLMKNLIEYFGCGNVHFSKKAVSFVVEKFSDLLVKIIPFFLRSMKYTILGVKGQDFTPRISYGRLNLWKKTSYSAWFRSNS